jgi:Zn-dependent M28 family amino/carboxypeptidase
MIGLLLLAPGFARGEQIPDFPAPRAWGYLVAQCAFGPRVPGTPAHEQCLSYLEKSLRAAGGDVSIHSFRAATDASRDSLKMTNVTARFGPSGQGVILGAHWDSRPWADQDPDSSMHARPILGANDGGSGVAVLLALSELFQRQPPPVPVEIALFDAEDQGRADHPDGFLLGSWEYARRLIPPFPRAVLVLDMVGGSDLQICREGYSQEAAGWLNDMLFGEARDLGLSGFEDRVCYSVLDDHYPFLQRGIAAVDLVDMHYRQWHTIGDAPRSCSQESLEQTGRLLVSFLYGGSLQ